MEICQHFFLAQEGLTLTKCLHYFYWSFVHQTLLKRLWNDANHVRIYISDTQGSTLMCCDELLPGFRCLSCSSNLHVWLSTYALLFRYCSENDLCCGRVLIGLALQCVCVCVCTGVCLYLHTKCLRMYMSACWQRERCRSLSPRPSTCGSPPVWVALYLCS